MLPAEEQLLKNNNLRTLTVFSYFDYACLNPEKKNAFGQVEASIIADAPLCYGAVVEDYSTVDQQMSIIHSKVRENTLTDVVMITVYQMLMNNDGYNNLRNIVNIPEENLVLDIFKNNLYQKGTIVVRGVFPYTIVDRVTLERKRS